MASTPETHPAVISVECKELTIGYKAKRTGFREVAADINAELCGGRLTSLIGSNGIGKSTLLRTLSAFQPPLAGDVLVQGKSLRRYTNKELSRLIGVVLTERPALQNMSVRELVGLGRSPYTGFWGKLTAADEDIVTEAINDVGIENLQHRMIQTLSDGERQKVMIAKALAQQTPVIFLDEPTAFLDYPSKVEVMQLLHRLTRQSGKTIFLSTHDIELALQLSDILWLMSKTDTAPSTDASLSQLTIGTPQQLAQSDALTAFIERKGITFDRTQLSIRVENQG
ncbi:MAG: ABC transporter ATP-binding protein [Prevotella sp.]|nr:ABC transporter ATP-binding protein [Prevotella sp.]